MSSTPRPRRRRVVATLTVVAMAVSIATITATGVAAEASSDTTVRSLDTRDSFIVGRFRDHSDFGDFSSPLTHALALLALHRDEQTAPSDAAVELLLAQQCADGGFPDQFLAPSTEDAPACASAVDTTAFVAQALHAVGEVEAVDTAASWLVDEQADDGSFGSADGTNTNSTGLAALALSLAGEDGAAEAARDWVHGQQDGCETDSPGAIPFNVDERGVAEISTAQALLGLTSTSLAEVSADGIDAELPDAPCDDPDATVDDAPELAAAWWLASVLTDDPGVDTGFGASAGASADAVFAFAAVEVGGDTVDAIADWLETQAEGYTRGAGFDAEDAAYAGASAKLALAMQVAGRDARSTGGIDLVEQLEAREAAEADPVELACDVPEAGVTPGSEVTCSLARLLPSETVRARATANPTLFDAPVTGDGAGEASFAFEVADDLTADDEVEVTVDGLGVEGLAATTFAIDDEDGATDPPPDDGDDSDDQTPADDDQDPDPAVPVPTAPADGTRHVAGSGQTTQPTRDRLPETGVDTWVASMVASSLLACGALLLSRTRRRSDHT